MTEEEVNTVNAFMAREDLTGADLALKVKILATNKELQDLRTDLEKSSEVLRQKQVRSVNLSAQLEGYLGLVLDLSKS